MKLEYILGVALLLEIVFAQRSLNTIKGGSISYRYDPQSDEHILVDFYLSVAKDSDYGKACQRQTKEREEHTQNTGISLRIWRGSSYPRETDKGSFIAYIKYYCELPELATRNYPRTQRQIIYGTHRVPISMNFFFVGFNNKDTDNGPLFTQFANATRPDTGERNFPARAAVFGTNTVYHDEDSLKFLVTDTNRDHIRCEVEDKTLEGCALSLQHLPKTKKFTKTFNVVVTKFAHSSMSGSSFASRMSFLVEVERLVAPLSASSSARAEIMAGVPSCLSVHGNVAHVEEHDDTIGRSVREIAYERVGGRRIITRADPQRSGIAYTYNGTVDKHRPEGIYPTCYRIVTEDPENNYIYSKQVCTQVSTLKDGFALKTEYNYPKHGGKVDDVKTLNVVVHGAMKEPTTFSVAILEYETDKSVYSFDYNERNIKEHYKTENDPKKLFITNITITLPYMTSLVANRKYYVIFNKYPYALPGCKDHQRDSPMNKDEWTFTTETVSNNPPMPIDGGEIKHETELMCKHDSFSFTFKQLHNSTMPIKKVTLLKDDCEMRYDRMSNIYDALNIMFTKCGTQMSEDKHHIVFSNIARVYYTNQTTSNSLITRTKTMNIKLECRLPKTQINTLRGKPTRNETDGGPEGIVVGPQFIEIHDTARSNASFRIDFQVYKSLQYGHSYGREEFPIYLAVSNRIYFEVSIDKKDLSILPRTCYATKTQSYQDEQRYHLIQDSCPKDQTYAMHNDNIAKNKFRFSVQAFNFKDGGDSIFVHCHTYVCKNQTDEQCQFGCRNNGGRSRRSIELKEEVEGYMTSTLEIKIKGDKIAVIHNRSSSDEETTDDQSKTMLLYLQIPVAIAVFGLLFFVYKCLQKRSASSNGGVFFEEEMKLKKNEML